MLDFCLYVTIDFPRFLVHILGRRYKIFCPYPLSLLHRYKWLIIAILIAFCRLLETITTIEKKIKTYNVDKDQQISLERSKNLISTEHK